MSENSKQHKILIVDDAQANIRILMDMLCDEYELFAVMDGENAIMQVISYPPDLVLLDVMMPGIDGFEVCRHLKKNPAARDIPIIFLTALKQSSDKTRGFEVGAADYITKPFDPTEVLARVRTHLELKCSREAIQKTAEELERRVESRTAELMISNTQLRDEAEQHRRAVALLQASEYRYRLLTENVADGVYILQKGKLTFANPAFNIIFGCFEKGMVGNALNFMILEDHRARFEMICEKTEADGQIRAFQFPCVCVDGREIWIEGQHNIIQWEENPGILGTLRDITERKRRETNMSEEKESLLRELEGLKTSVRDCYKFGNIIGKSQVMQEIYTLIADAARADANVIIYGESGTGKELIARTIHDQSGRRDHVFVPVNCGAIPDALFESEFFGYRKGAFTGADTNKPGFFEYADGGTLFLDEVGELPPAMQVKLLRAIENGEYTPVGDTKARTTDVRIISATNSKPGDFRGKQGIREDFLYRIHVIPIHLPRLKERKEDILLLAEHFMKSGSTENIQTLPPRMLRFLHSHDWPGNVRELRNTLERYLALGSLDLITIPSSDADGENADEGDISLNKALKLFEKKFISNALSCHQGHRARTAKQLEINERTLYRKMQQHGLV